MENDADNWIIIVVFLSKIPFLAVDSKKSSYFCFCISGNIGSPFYFSGITVRRMTCPEGAKSIRLFGRRCAPSEQAQGSRRTVQGTRSVP
jgi:hypothetical protein